MQDDRVMRERINKKERVTERETWEFKGRLWGRVQDDRVMRERTNKRERVRERERNLRIQGKTLRESARW